jgi:hypothetical protein
MSNGMVRQVLESSYRFNMRKNMNTNLDKTIRAEEFLNNYVDANMSDIEEQLEDEPDLIPHIKSVINRRRAAIESINDTFGNLPLL